MYQAHYSQSLPTRYYIPGPILAWTSLLCGLIQITFKHHQIYLIYTPFLMHHSNQIFFSSFSYVLLFSLFYSPTSLSTIIFRSLTDSSSLIVVRGYFLLQQQPSFTDSITQQKNTHRNLNTHRDILNTKQKKQKHQWSSKFRTKNK